MNLAGHAKMLFYYLKYSTILGKGIRGKLDLFWKFTKKFRVNIGMEKFNPHQIMHVYTKIGSFYMRDNFGDIYTIIDFYKSADDIVKTASKKPMIDIGANIGMISAAMKKKNPHNMIYSFEPVESSANLIRKNCPSAKVHVLALGSKRGTVDFNVDTHSIMAAKIKHPYETKKMSFDVDTLDSFIEKNRIDGISLMKIDVEGMELDVLGGGKKALEIAENIMLETHGKDNFDRCRKILSKKGFELDIRKLDGFRHLIIAKK